MASNSHEKDAIEAYLSRWRKMINNARATSLVIGIGIFLILLVVEDRDISRILSALGRFFTTLSFLSVIAKHDWKEEEEEQAGAAVRSEVATILGGSGSADAPSRGQRKRVCWSITKAHVLGLEENADWLDILKLVSYVLGLGTFLALTVLEGERVRYIVTGVGAMLVALPALHSLILLAEQGTEEDHLVVDIEAVAPREMARLPGRIREDAQSQERMEARSDDGAAHREGTKEIARKPQI